MAGSISPPPLKIGVVLVMGGRPSLAHRRSAQNRHDGRSGRARRYRGPGASGFCDRARSEAMNPSSDRFAT
jgi:hypothetical protein